MRNILLGLGAALAIGCTSEPADIEHQSRLSARTSGVALDSDGDMGVAGMGGMSCAFDTRSGAITIDEDITAGEDVVLDTTVDGTGDVVLVGSGGEISLVYPEESGWGFFRTEGLQADGSVVDGAFTGTDIVALVDGERCGVQSWDELGSDFTTLPNDVCAGATNVIGGSGGIVFVANDDGVTVVTADGVVEGDAQGEIAAWDPVAEVLYVATAGDTVLTGMNQDGTVRWTTELGGEIVALDVLGDRGQAAVMVEYDAEGALVVVDGISGDIENEVSTPTGATDLQVSGDAGTMAVVLPNEVHMFRILGL